eukprot:jgi/Mesvir1/9417/Mv01519-RA.1
MEAGKIVDELLQLASTLSQEYDECDTIRMETASQLLVARERQKLAELKLQTFEEEAKARPQCGGHVASGDLSHWRAQLDFRDKFHALQKEKEEQAAVLASQVEAWRQQADASRKEAERLAARIREMEDGRVAACGELEAAARRSQALAESMEAAYREETASLCDELARVTEENGQLVAKLRQEAEAATSLRAQLEEERCDARSNRNSEAFKQKIMQLRKENEQLRRELGGLRK